eukprot:292481-Chlamydomonas_euryale.AAC.3
MCGWCAPATGMTCRTFHMWIAWDVDMPPPTPVRDAELLHTAHALNCHTWHAGKTAGPLAIIRGWSKCRYGGQLCDHGVCDMAQNWEAPRAAETRFSKPQQVVRGLGKKQYTTPGAGAGENGGKEGWDAGGRGRRAPPVHAEALIAAAPTAEARLCRLALGCPRGNGGGSAATAASCCG